MARPTELERRRAHECRLTPDRALASLDEAAAWVLERGLVTGRPGSSLPSLHVAIHEEPYRPGKGGFAEWPRTKWWWGHSLAERPDIHALKIRRGKSVLVADAVVATADPLCRAELARADEGALGHEAQRLVRHLAEGGRAFLDDVKLELSLDTRALRAVRGTLERVGAVVSRQLSIETPTGRERYVTELSRWDQLAPEATGEAADPVELLIAGVRAAVLAPEHEARHWFSWSVSEADVDRLIEERRLERHGASLASGS